MTAHKGQPAGWAGETSLDVQWAHAVAPEATINLVVAPNNYGSSLNVAVRRHPGEVSPCPPMQGGGPDASRPGHPFAQWVCRSGPFSCSAAHRLAGRKPAAAAAARVVKHCSGFVTR